MFETLKEQAPDAILSLMTEYRADTREGKIDLGVGVYKNAKGVTPIMRAVKAAEERIWSTQDSKSYTGLAGEADYRDALAQLILGDALPQGRLASAATPGGTGAIRQAFELIKQARPDAVVWVSAPTWPNHLSILRHMDIPFREYRYFDAATGEVDGKGLLADLAQVAQGDVVLLHGCCHNPTGANPDAALWDQIIDAVKAAGALPMVDIAYQGFGDGLDQDATAVRKVVAACSEVLIAASCSKNFGIYRERTGLLMGTVQDAAQLGALQGMLAHLNRQNFSFPPDHGARIVATVLADDGLRADWMEELEEMRQSMLGLRQQLADELRQRTNSDRFDFLTRHRGMFSRVGLTPDQVTKLKTEHAVYMVGDSRINIAGLNSESIPRLAQAIASVL